MRWLSVPAGPPAPPPRLSVVTCLAAARPLRRTACACARDSPTLFRHPPPPLLFLALSPPHSFTQKIIVLLRRPAPPEKCVRLFACAPSLIYHPLLHSDPKS